MTFLVFSSISVFVANVTWMSSIADEDVTNDIRPASRLAGSFRYGFVAVKGFRI